MTFKPYRAHLIAFALALAATAGLASETFTAVAEFESERTLGTSRVGFSLVIDHATSLEEARRLRSLLAEGGQELLRSALRGRRDGRARLGALEIAVDLIVIVPIEDGRRFYVVTDRALRRSPDPNVADAEYPFGVLVFEVNDRGSGEGTFRAAAALSIDEEGAVVASDRSEPGRLLEVKLQD